jgi:hypothetical protein
MPALADTKQKNNNKRRATKVIALTAALVVAGGAAFAWWTAGGSGTGSASTGNVSALTVVQTSTVSGLAPGLPAQTLSGNFNNPNSGPVYVASVTASIASVTDTNGDPITGCDNTDYALANAAMTVGAEVPSGNAKGSWTGATLAFNNKASNQDACKGAVVHLAYTAS